MRYIFNILFRVLLLSAATVQASLTNDDAVHVFQPTLGPILSEPQQSNFRIWLRGPVIDREPSYLSFHGIIAHKPHGTTEWLNTITFPLNVHFDAEGIKGSKDFTGFGELPLGPGTHDYKCGYYVQLNCHTPLTHPEFIWPSATEVHTFITREKQVNGTALVFGSCRYFARLWSVYVELENSDQIFKKILDHSSEGLPIDGICFLGDNIYADSLRMGNYCETYEDYQDLYEKAWGTNNMKKVLATYPMALMCDDHEFYNNIMIRENLHEHYIKAGIAAYGTYQYMTTPGFKNDSVLPFGGYAFSIRGIPGFMLDNRGNRTTVPKRIISDEEMAALKAWLLGNKESPYKLIFSGTPVFPAFDKASDDNVDQWLGHPKQLREMLRYIDAEEIRGVVFCSGDIHLSAYAKIITPKGITITNVTASPFHFPWWLEWGKEYYLETENGIDGKELIKGFPYSLSSKAYRTDAFARLEFPGEQLLNVKFYDKEGNWLNKDDPAGWQLRV